MKPRTGVVVIGTEDLFLPKLIDPCGFTFGLPPGSVKLVRTKVERPKLFGIIPLPKWLQWLAGKHWYVIYTFAIDLSDHPPSHPNCRCVPIPEEDHDQRKEKVC